MSPAAPAPARSSRRGDADGAARSRRQRAHLRRRSRQQRRARGVGRHRQDVGARRALRQPAQARRRSGEHPGDHVHAQGRRRDARAHRARAARGRRARRRSIGSRWLELRDRLGDIAISTIDAFCLSLLREFPLEADLDPGFDMADETEVPRLVEDALDRALRILPGQSRTDPDVALVFAQLGDRADARGARRRCSIAGWWRWDALDRFLAHGPADLDRRAGLPPTSADRAAGRARRRTRRSRAVPRGRSGRRTRASSCSCARFSGVPALGEAGRARRSAACSTASRPTS